MPRLPQALMLAVCLTGCTTESWYEGVRQAGIEQCMQQPPSMQAACQSRVTTVRYSDYCRNGDASSSRCQTP